MLIVGILSPIWLFLFNFSRYVTSHKASQDVEVLAVTEKGEELSNVCRISPSGKIDSFYCVKPNYFSREDEWGQGKGYIKTIGVRAEDSNKIKRLLIRCGDRIYTWSAEKLRIDWKREDESFVLENIPATSMPFYGRVMNYAGNEAVARAVLVPTLLMSLVLLTLTFLFHSLNKDFRPDLSRSQNIYSHLFHSRQGKLFSWTCITSVVIFYLYNYFTLPPYIHAETYITFPRLANSAEEKFLGSMFQKSFDLGRVEEGGYRPRALAFIIGYTETNLMIWLNNKFPAFGPRLPFMLVAALLLVFSVYHLTRTLLPKIPLEAALIIGCSMLFFQNFQATTYLYLRSAKALCPGVCILLLDFYFRHRNTVGWPASIFRSAFYVLLIFLACTLDEQVIAVLLLVLLLSIFSWMQQKRAGFVFYMSAAALLLYVVFHFTAYSLLFSPYTPNGIHPHDHSFTDPFFSFGLESIQRAGEIGMHLASSLGASWILLLPAVVLTSVLWMKISTADKTTSAILILFSFLLIGGVIGSHRTAYFCQELWNGAYFLPAACVMLAVVIFIWGKGISEVSITRAAVLITFVFLVNIFINTLRIDVFYNNYTSVQAGERGVIVDPHDGMSAEHAKFFDGARKPALRLERIATANK